MPRLLLASSNIASPRLAEAVSGVIRQGGRGAIITTAEAKRKECAQEIVLAASILKSMGAPSIEFFDLDARTATALADFDFIYIAGGNPLYLLKRMRETHADEVLEGLMAEGRPIIGVGAAAAVLGQNLRPLRTFDQSAPDFGWKDLEGLGAVPIAVLPQANRWQARFADYSARLAAARVFCRCEIKELLDGEGFIFDGTSLISIGASPQTGESAGPVHTRSLAPESTSPAPPEGQNRNEVTLPEEIRRRVAQI